MKSISAKLIHPVLQHMCYQGAWHGARRPTYVETWLVGLVEPWLKVPHNYGAESFDSTHSCVKGRVCCYLQNQLFFRGWYETKWIRLIEAKRIVALYEESRG